MDESKDDIRKRRQKEFDAKETVPFPEKLKSDAEKLLECRKEMRFQKVRIETLAYLLQCYRKDNHVMFANNEELRKRLQDNA